MWEKVLEVWGKMWERVCSECGWSEQSWKYRLKIDIDILYFFVIECKNSLLFFHNRLEFFPIFLRGKSILINQYFFLNIFFQNFSFFGIFSILSGF